MLHEAPADLRLGDDVESLAGGIDHGCAGDADFRIDIQALLHQVGCRIDCRTPRGDQVDLGVDPATIAIDRINAVVLSCYVHNIVGAPRDLHAGHDQRLSIDLAIERDLEEPAELIDTDVGGGKNLFVSVGPGPGGIVVPGCDIDLGLR